MKNLPAWSPSGLNIRWRKGFKDQHVQSNKLPNVLQNLISWSCGWLWLVHFLGGLFSFLLGCTPVPTLRIHLFPPWGFTCSHLEDSPEDSPVPTLRIHHVPTFSIHHFHYTSKMCLDSNSSIAGYSWEHCTGANAGPNCWPTWRFRLMVKWVWEI